MHTLRRNGLAIAFSILFLLTLVGQAVAGHRHYNEEQAEHGEQTVAFGEYLSTGEFIETVFENWESEFLQMFAYVILTVFLYQRGSAESKKLHEHEDVDEDPRDHLGERHAPKPVRRGDWMLPIYEHSLSLAFFLLFAFSFLLHAYGGMKDYNEEALAHAGSEQLSLTGYFATSRFWYESFQNWQSEFLAVLAIVVFSIYLREKGSPESKPVHAPHSKTGKE